MDQPKTQYRKYEQVGIPQVAGRTYQNFKTYIGATQLPSFALGTTIFPTFDLSKNVDTSKELKFNTLTFALTQLPSVGWATNAAYALVLPCPEGSEHLYRNLTIKFDPVASSAATSKYKLYVASEAPISQTPDSFAVNVNPAVVPQLVQVAKLDTTAAEWVLDNSVLPIYVPPKGFLVIFPSEVSVDPDGLDLYVQYQRVERTAGVGPLVY